MNERFVGHGMRPDTQQTQTVHVKVLTISNFRNTTEFCKRTWIVGGKGLKNPLSRSVDITENQKNLARNELLTKNLAFAFSRSRQRTMARPTLTETQL